ncbi:MAG TPA: DNA polymerase III subunit beta [Candidatus Coprenecus stercoripullorum]|nr:DNA polymerase III subunit beta [Candidatus Coprenecus stercoripullorum]
MRFIVSSSELLRGLLSVSRVISQKNAMHILDNFLFVLKGNTLEVTASDAEMTLRTVINIDNVSEEGSIAVPARLLTDSLKEFPDMPIELRTLELNTLEINWNTGSSKIPIDLAEYYPELPAIDESAISIRIPATTLYSGIDYTMYATAEETLRPVMNGILFDLTDGALSLVASDSHKLVCYSRKDITSDIRSSFILPKKPAAILRSALAKSEEEVEITFDSRNVRFLFKDNLLVCRTVDGTYPAYRTVIPKNNPNKIIIGRIEFLNAVKRVSVCSNQATSNMSLTLSFNKLTISAQDTSYSTSAHEDITCQYDGEPMVIGFKSNFLIEILSNLPYDEICFELSDPARAGLIVSAQEKDPDEDICALIMPIRLA